MIDYDAIIAELETWRENIGSAIETVRRLKQMAAARGPEPGDSTSQAPLRGHHHPVVLKRVSLKRAAAEKPDGAGGLGPVRDAILACLQANGPLTSIETFEALTKSGVKTTSGSVYQTLRLMREKGILDNGQNDVGTVTWKPKGKAAAAAH